MSCLAPFVHPAGAVHRAHRGYSNTGRDPTPEGCLALLPSPRPLLRCAGERIRCRMHRHGHPNGPFVVPPGRLFLEPRYPAVPVLRPHFYWAAGVSDDRARQQQGASERGLTYQAGVCVSQKTRRCGADWRLLPDFYSRSSFSRRDLDVNSGCVGGVGSRVQVQAGLPGTLCGAPSDLTFPVI